MMGESVQAVLALLMIVGMIGSALVFMNDRPSWPMLAATMSLAVGSLGLLIWSMIRKDKAPDFLKSKGGRAFERDGFCFTVGTKVEKGRCHVVVHFQSRYELPSQATIVLLPSKGFFLLRPELASVTVEMNCPPGGFGVTNIPWPVPKATQGKKQSLDVAADVRYPEGKGRMIRYRGGVQVGPAGINVWQGILTVAGAMGGVIVLSKPAKITLTLPTDVEESVADDLPITTEILWKVGDPVAPSSAPKKMATVGDFRP